MMIFIAEQKNTRQKKLKTPWDKVRISFHVFLSKNVDGHLIKRHWIKL